MLRWSGSSVKDMRRSDHYSGFYRRIRTFWNKKCWINLCVHLWQNGQITACGPFPANETLISGPRPKIQRSFVFYFFSYFNRYQLFIGTRYLNKSLTLWPPINFYKIKNTILSIIYLIFSHSFRNSLRKIKRYEETSIPIDYSK